MAFNFRQYTSNNPLLQELENIDQYAEDGEYANEEVTVSSSGVEMGQSSKTPRADLEQAIFNAKSNGVKKHEALYYIDLVYGKDVDEDKDYISSKEFDYMSDDELDAAGLTGDKIGPEN